MATKTRARAESRQDESSRDDRPSAPSDEPSLSDRRQDELEARAEASQRDRSRLESGDRPSDPDRLPADRRSSRDEKESIRDAADARAEERRAEAAGLKIADGNDMRAEIAAAVARRRKGLADPDEREDDDEGTGGDRRPVRRAETRDDDDRTADDDDQREARRRRRHAARSNETIDLSELDPDEMVEVTVGGRTIEIAAGELAARREDKRREERREAPRRDTRTIPPAPPAPRGETPEQKAARLAKRKALVARIQYGEEEDALAALDELENSAVEKARAAIQGDQQAHEIVAERRTEIVGAMNAVERDYPDIVENPDFLQAATRRVVEDIRKAFEAIDLKEAKNGALDQMGHFDLINAYVGMRKHIMTARPELLRKMPKVEDIFLDAADEVDETYVTPEYLRSKERREHRARAEADRGREEPRRRIDADGREVTRVREHDRRVAPVRDRDIETRTERKRHVAPQPRGGSSIRADLRREERGGADPEARQRKAASVIEQMRDRTRGVPLRGSTRH